MNANLLDIIIALHPSVKNDAGIARALGSSPPAISKMRSELIACGPAYIVNIHLKFDIPIAEIKHLIGIGRPVRVPRARGVKRVPS